MYAEQKLQETFGNTPKTLKKNDTKTLEKAEVRTAAKTVELPNAFGISKVVAGDLSIRDARFALVNGLCGDLALAIHKKTGGDPYFVCYGIESEEELLENFENDPESIFELTTHVLIESPTQHNRYVDAYGQKTFEELSDFYGDDIELIQGNMDMLKKYAPDSDSEKFEEFAETAIKLDQNGESYNYHEDEDDE